MPYISKQEKENTTYSETEKNRPIHGRDQEEEKIDHRVKETLYHGMTFDPTSTFSDLKLILKRRGNVTNRRRILHKYCRESVIVYCW